MPAALAAARLSPDSRGWRMIDLPCARPAMVTARMVCDLLDGISTLPRRVDFSLIIFMGLFRTPQRVALSVEDRSVRVNGATAGVYAFSA
jgi:hypothetical protein